MKSRALSLGLAAVLAFLGSGPASGQCDVDLSATWYVDALDYNVFGDNFAVDGSGNYLNATTDDNTLPQTGNPLEYTLNLPSVSASSVNGAETVIWPQLSTTADAVPAAVQSSRRMPATVCTAVPEPIPSPSR